LKDFLSNNELEAKLLTEKAPSNATINQALNPEAKQGKHDRSWA